MLAIPVEGSEFHKEKLRNSDLRSGKWGAGGQWPKPQHLPRPQVSGWPYLPSGTFRGTEGKQIPS